MLPNRATHHIYHLSLESYVTCKYELKLKRVSVEKICHLEKKDNTINNNNTTIYYLIYPGKKNII